MTLLSYGFYLFHSNCFTILHAHAAIAFRSGVCATFANDFPTAVPPGCLAMLGLVMTNEVDDTLQSNTTQLAGVKLRSYCVRHASKIKDLL